MAITIAIQGRAAVDPNTTRNDAQPGDVVTLTLSSASDTVEMVWGPKDGFVGWSQTTATTRRFTIPDGAYGTYRFRYTDSGGTVLLRELGVLTPNRGLRIPPLGSKASPDAGTRAPLEAWVALSDNNASYVGEPRLDETGGKNFTGYAIDVEKLFLTVDQLAGAVDDLVEGGGGEGGEGEVTSEAFAQLTQQVTDHEDRLDDLDGVEERVLDLETWRTEAVETLNTVDDLDARVDALEGAPGSVTRLLKQFATESVTGMAAYNMGALYFQQGDMLPATARTLLGASGGVAIFEIVDEATSNVVASASTSAPLAAVAFDSGAVTFPTTGIYSMRLRGSAANTAAIFRGIDWTVTS